MAEPGTFVVEAVRGRRRRKHKLQYLVEWKGYPAAADQTWEPLANLDGCGAKVAAELEDSKAGKATKASKMDIPEQPAVASYAAVLEALQSVSIPVNRTRTNVKTHDAQVVTGMCLGVVHSRSNGITTSNFGRDRPNLTRLLVEFGKQNCPGFNFTSIQVNKNYQSGLHVDRNNLGKSMIVGLGDYKDGGLWVHMKGEVDLRKTWYEFDGNVPHCTLPYSGTRYTLIYFIQQSYRKLGRIRKDKNQDKRLLESLGFELPTNVTKLDYEPKNIRMLKGKASFRKWDSCRQKGVAYEWADDEDVKTWQRDEDFAERRDDWSDDEDEDEDSWQMRRVMLDPKVREQVELMTGKTCRRLARTGGLTEPAKGLMALEKLEKLNYSLRRKRKHSGMGNYAEKGLAQLVLEAAPAAAKASAEEEGAAEEETYDVEKILRVRHRGSHGHIVEFLVQWQGFDNSHNTWEPRRNCEDSEELIEEFYTARYKPVGKELKWLQAAVRKWAAKHLRFGFASGAGEGGSTAGIEVPVLRAGFLATGGAPLPPLRKCKIFKDVLQELAQSAGQHEPAAKAAAAAAASAGAVGQQRLNCAWLPKSPFATNPPVLPTTAELLATPKPACMAPKAPKAPKEAKRPCLSSPSAEVQQQNVADCRRGMSPQGQPSTRKRSKGSKGGSDDDAFFKMQINVPASGVPPGSLCKILSPTGDVHFVTIPRHVKPSSSFIRTLPKVFTAATLASLDSQELWQWFRHRNINTPDFAAGASDVKKNEALIELASKYLENKDNADETSGNADKISSSSSSSSSSARSDSDAPWTDKEFNCSNCKQVTQSVMPHVAERWAVEGCMKCPCNVNDRPHCPAKAARYSALVKKITNGDATDAEVATAEEQAAELEGSFGFTTSAARSVGPACHRQSTAKDKLKGDGLAKKQRGQTDAADRRRAAPASGGRLAGGGAGRSPAKATKAAQQDSASTPKAGSKAGSKALAPQAGRSAAAPPTKKRTRSSLPAKRTSPPPAAAAGATKTRSRSGPAKRRSVRAHGLLKCP